MRATPSLTPSDPVHGPAANNGCITPSNAVMGSWPYMPPEQWMNYAVGPAADTYALGVLAYEALTGRVPFFAETRDEYVALHFYGHVPGVGWSALDRIFERALQVFQGAPRQRAGAGLGAARRAAGEPGHAASQLGAALGRPRPAAWPAVGR